MLHVKKRVNMHVFSLVFFERLNYKQNHSLYQGLYMSLPL